MKKLLLFFFLVNLTYFSANAQNKKRTVYIDVNNKEISESSFKKRAAKRTAFLGITGDSIHHRKLVKRVEKGVMKDRGRLIAQLEKAIGEKIDSSSTLVILYYPGKDSCNVGNSVGFLNMKNLAIEKGANQITKTKIVYIYKDDTPLDSDNRWTKDPENSIEKRFFKYHYPCGSFVVIGKNGPYESYFGEYPLRFVLAAINKLSR